MKKIIYSLCCPFTEEVHYIGKSSVGMKRPIGHLKKSHADKVNCWVEDLKVLGQKPKIKILEVVSEIDNLDDRELYWIDRYLKKGSLLLNINLISPKLVITKLERLLVDLDFGDISHISKFISTRRRLIGLNQLEFAEKCGIAVTVLRKIEQGKTNVNLNSVLQILSMFGSTIDIKIIRGGEANSVEALV